MEKEIWKDIKDFEGLYKVSNLGRVKGIERKVKKAHGERVVKERILKPRENKNGYLYANLSKNCIPKNYSIHRLVAIAFIPNPNNYPEVNHKKEFEKGKNTVDNLEWCTKKYNLSYGTHAIRQAKSCSKTVYQYTLDGKFIKKWESTSECQRNGFTSGNISGCCNGKRKTHRGYIWSYSVLDEHCNG